MKTSPSDVTQVVREEEITTLFTDYDHICISVEEFTELMKAKASLDILRNLYMAFESYDYDRMLSAFFGAKKGKDDA